MAYVLTFNGRGVEVTDSIKNFVEDKLNKLPHIDMATSIHVEIGQTMSHKGKSNDFYVRILVNLPRAQVRYKKEGDEVYTLVDGMMPSLRNKLVKYKENFRQWEGEEAWPEAKVLEGMKPTEDDLSAMYAGYTPPVRKKVFKDTAPMSVSEAIERMELLDKPYFIFKNVQTGTVSVVARTNEGYELVSTD